MLKPKENIYILIFTILTLLYILFVLIPYANKEGFFNEAVIPSGSEKFYYGLLSIPVLSLYAIYIINNLNKITFPKSIIYPLLIITGYIGLFMCLIIEGGAVLWLMIFTIIIPIILVPVCFIIGIKRDVDYLKKRTKN